MNMNLKNINLEDENINKRVNIKRIVHVKNTYISPYVLYNKKGNNNSQLDKLNKIFTSENNCRFSKECYNYVKDGDTCNSGENYPEYCSTNVKQNNTPNYDQCNNEKKILKYGLLNEQNMKFLKKKKEEDFELNTISTMIHIYSDYESDKDNETITNEYNDLIDCIKKINISNNKCVINNDKRIEDALLSPYDQHRKCSYQTIGHKENYSNKNNDNNSDNKSDSDDNGEKRVRRLNNFISIPSVSNKSCIEHAHVQNNHMDTVHYDNYICNKENRDNNANDTIYKCEESIPLGTILNIHNLDSNNNALTTVMLRNIPNKYTQNMLMDVMNEHFKGLYDFFYLPIDFRNKCNVGYAFINFIHPHYAELFIKFFNNYKLNAFKSNKICTVTWGRVQGLKANIEHYRNSAIMTISVPQYKPILFQNGISVSWPESDGPLPAIKLRSHKY
ncbi:RNA-binding protein, putative [Plasmodium berghei]|uniref:MEI2-like RNA-binding protein, putative n=2 Tax=Plasmodium berghei TaxID=5821 RepID=A0A509AMG0_PLABA|nr:MEI2-like RNA-binding protein, putative [Plasmodium berghei ANKA]CXI64322.1 RNA-binding protein, putative [Plasmodium berghei]SCM23868.1 RNA-binding protein, putative [Plasmodium berghei]SCN26813.1 RNA-binding protein, putative [Plasmodium berghei]SCO61174.1 RNA-binding protein, putative [Plasmodium berghei]SCO63233.1 RNA-binding protein, putative [Plasmodium berghei]|eukprot:XP_034422430.1 MEI2-like RNA-binding protein, putative [Plasmodium berghei ANKA]